jgi:hypothetical protein
MKTFTDFYSGITGSEKQIVDQLRKIALETYPDFIEKISYGVPYYFRNTRVCFIWPASIKPGPKSGVYFGLCNGHLIEDEWGILEKENRKVVATITFHSVDEINPEIIREVLAEALMVDDQVAKPKKAKLRK